MLEWHLVLAAQLAVFAGLVVGLVLFLRRRRREKQR
jgi:hypothetical protein